jgi:hypothetical protein
MHLYNEELLKLLQTFHRFELKYLIIGGFAVNRYGFKRTTGDIDFYLKDSLQNRQRLVDALDHMQYGRFEALLEMPILAGYCEIMLDNGMYADLMTDIPGLLQQEYDIYYSEALVDKIDSFEIRYINYNHLILNKIATNRTKDIIDVTALKNINHNN